MKVSRVCFSNILYSNYYMYFCIHLLFLSAAIFYFSMSMFVYIDV